MPEGEKRGRIGGRSTNPYYEDHKYPEPTVCPRCHLVYHNGRWQRQETAPSEAAGTAAASHENHCPACRREMDRMPGGLVSLRGTYWQAHRDEIEHILRNQEKSAAAHRPLQRIMWFEASDVEAEVATTNPHLAVRMGKAVESACKGNLVVKHGQGDQLVRVYWERNDSA